MVLSIANEEMIVAEVVPRRERRSGMAYVFEGISPVILERLGWTSEQIEEAEKSLQMNDEQITVRSESNVITTETKTVENARPLSTSSEVDDRTSVVEDFTYDSDEQTTTSSHETMVAFQKCIISKQRRNAVADLFSGLSEQQKELLLQLCGHFSNED